MTFTRVHQLGEAGGQGEVWLVRDGDGHQYAMKCLRMIVGSNNETERARFAREVKCMTMLKHPGIIPVISSDLDSPVPYFIMPLASQSLRAVLNSADGPLEKGLSIRYFNEILAAIKYAHNEGVIHRDLKPENVLMMANGNDSHVAVSDFGLGRRFANDTATLTQTNVGLGTFGYSAPEQFFSAHAADERADIYALGCILYELVVGKPLFVTRKIELAPAEFRYVIHRATKQDPEDRYESVRDFEREIALLSDQERLQPPSERARDLIADSLAGDHTALDPLVQILLAGSEDLELYLQVLTSCPAPVLSSLALDYREEFRTILVNYCAKTAGGHPFSFTDTIADFPLAAFNVTDDLSVQEAILERLLILGHDHNRWYVRAKFVKLAVEAMRNPQLVLAVQGLLRADSDRTKFVRAELLEQSIPATIRELLAA